MVEHPSKLLTRRHGDRHDDLITDAKNRLRDMGVIP